MHPAHPPNTGLMQFATQAQQMGESAKHRRLGLVFQTVSAVSVVVMGAIASAKLYREVFGHGHGPQHSHVQNLTKADPDHGHGPKPSHSQRHAQGGHGHSHGRGRGRGEATQGR